MSPILVLIIIAVQAVIGGYLARHLAEQKGYDGYFWFGFFLGVLGVAYVAGLPLSEEMREREMEDFISRLRRREEQPAPAPEPERRYAPPVHRDPPQAPGEPVRGVAQGEGQMACPFCGQVQREDRMVCFKCGARFIQRMEKEDDARE